MISVVLFLISFIMQPAASPYMVIKEKSITVDGNTSIGGFSCTYNLSGQSDTLFINNLAEAPFCFSLPVPAFKCGNFLLNRDFQHTLKADEYPEISVEVLSLVQNVKGDYTGKIKLNLVGKFKYLDDVKFQIKKLDKSSLLSANFLFKASEFELVPPSKLGGMIKADDEMTITVDLYLQ